MRAERAAASLAKRTVIVVREADFEAATAGLASFSLALAQPFARQTLGVLRRDALLRDMGVRDVVEGDDGFVEVLLRANADIVGIDALLAGVAGVADVGLLRTSEKTTAVVTCGEEDVYDVSSSLGAIAELAEAARDKSTDPFAAYDGAADVKEMKLLSSEERGKVLAELGVGWKFSLEGPDCLEGVFDFDNARQAHAFISRIELVARLTGSFPDIRQTSHRVSARLTTKSKDAVTQLDVSIARQLCVFYRRLSSHGG